MQRPADYCMACSNETKQNVETVRFPDHGSVGGAVRVGGWRQNIPLGARGSLTPSPYSSGPNSPHFIYWPGQGGKGCHYPPMW